MQRHGSMTVARPRYPTFARTLVDAATTRPFLNALLALKRERGLLERMRGPESAVVTASEQELADAA